MSKDELVIVLNGLIKGLQDAVKGLGGKAGKTSAPEPDEPEGEAEEPEEKEEETEEEETEEKSDSEPEEEEEAEEKPAKKGKAKADEEEPSEEESEEEPEEKEKDEEEEPAEKDEEEEEEKPRKKGKPSDEEESQEEEEEEKFSKKDEITPKERKLLDAFIKENDYAAKDMREDLEAFFEGSKDVFEKRVYDRIQKDPSDAEVAWLWANKLWVNFVTDDGVVAPAKTSYRRNKRLYHCARAWHKGEKCAICGAKRKADEAPAPEPKKKSKK